MGSHSNLKNTGTGPLGEIGGGDGRLVAAGDFLLTRQPSIYSLTFDEFQTTAGKDFGSMNMDELLKNIWSSGDRELQRQGSLTLPRTLSNKTVDEVWRGMSKDHHTVGLSARTKQPTLGEVTLEEFLVRAGVAREGDHHQSSAGGFFGDFPCVVGSPGLGFGYQEQQQALPNSVFGGIPCRHGQLATVAGIPAMNNSAAGLGSNGVTVMTGIQAHGIIKSNTADVSPSSVSPSPYAIRGRRGTVALEKVVERRQRRMIKNRESAARSRARKQAYTTELEVEIAKLKEEISELRKKQDKMLEMQKNQAVEMAHQRNRSKRRCLRRTRTCPW